MSNIIKSCLPATDNSLNGESRKKPSRKRHRNKSRNSNLKKKRLKKFHCRKKTSVVKSNNSKIEFIPNSNQIMSNWYWSNYRKAVEWQEKHKTAHWKACALALLEENNYLLQIINQLHPGMHPEVPVTHKHLNEGFSSFEKSINLNQSGGGANICEYVNTHDENYNDNENINDEDDDDDDDDDEDEDDGGNEGAGTNDDIEFEMSEEMMEFFQQSFKHKMELKELKEKQKLQSAEDEIKQMQTNKIKRATEMSQLYGDGASMIIGMETAVQLSFEKFCDTKSPKYWPNIPFRL